MKTKRIGVLTSGGDAPGMNAAVRAVVRGGIGLGLEVVGIKRGYLGLINNDMQIMDRKSVSGVIQRGGTCIYSARCPEMKTVEGQLQAVENIKKMELDGIVAIGGDGTFMGAKVLTEKYGIPTIGIPGTIDNDLAYTDFTLGFDTACNTAINCINNLRDTMNSHERVSVVEVMGRACGDIALYAGIASGAEIIIVPEVKISMTEIADRLRASRERGKGSNIVVLAEGVGDADHWAAKIEGATGMTVRGTNLGHILRGGSPTMADRLLGSQFGYRAVELLKNGIGNRVIGTVKGEIVDFDIIEALSQKVQFNEALYEASKILGM